MRRAAPFFGAQTCLFFKIFEKSGLAGTSQYRNAMWPGPYWRLWSDMIIHRIHLRVFDHIKRLSELG